MKFKSDDGREFEALPGESLKEGHFVIRPVKQEPKWEIKFRPYNYGHEIAVRLLYSDEDQAQLIKAWIEAGMKYMNDPMKDFPNEVAETYNAARQSMRENN